ncbi:Regulatory protein [Yarrowia sp. B02]|nr:Regulatory protein [Yarrowia sp. B02]
MTTYDLNYDYSFESLDSFDYLSESQVSTAATSPGVYEFPSGECHNGGVTHSVAPNANYTQDLPLSPTTPMQTPRQDYMVTPATIMSRAYSTSSTPFCGMKLNFETPVQETLLTPQSVSMDRSHSLPEAGVNPFYAPFELNEASDAEAGNSPTDSSSSESELAPPLFTNPFYKPQSFVQEVKSELGEVMQVANHVTDAVTEGSRDTNTNTSQVGLMSPPQAPTESASAKAAKMALSMADKSLFKSPEVQNLYSIIHTPHTPTVVPHNGVLSVSPEFEFTVCEKKFVCKHCDKRFKRHEHLKRHMKIHTDDRPFCCDIEGCGRKFSRSDNFRAHRRTHMKKGGRNSFVEGLQDQYTHRQKRRC